MARRGGKKRKVNVSVSTFVPKSHTPFQWVPQIGLVEMRDKQEFLKKEIRRLHLTFKWQSIWMSYLEGIFARGDRRLGSVMVNAHRLGCRFDGWSEYLNCGWWKEVLRDIDVDFYTTRRRYRDEVFPWDHIDCRVDRDFLWDEYQRAIKAQLTPDCRIAGCRGCGICCDEKQPIHGVKDGSTIADYSNEEGNIPNEPIQIVKEGKPYHRARARFAKVEKARFLSHLELVSLFSRAVRRADVPIRFSEGFHPLPKIVLGPALSVGIESVAEYMDLEINGDINSRKLLRKINGQLPSGLKLIDLREIPLKFPSIPDSISAIEYSLSLAEVWSDLIKDSQELSSKFRTFLKTKEKYIEVKRKSGILRIDLRQWVEGLQPKGDASIQMIVKMRGGRTVKPYDVLKGVLGLKGDEVGKISILKTGVRFTTLPFGD